jgi:putative ABC transport system ATP-binding protein
LLLADEPTGALDSVTTGEILDLFDRLHQEGATLIVVTHDREVAERAQRNVVMRDGRIVRDQIRPCLRYSDRVLVDGATDAINARVA